MPKIKVELEVPDSKYCRNCKYCKYVAGDYAICSRRFVVKEELHCGKARRIR